jgi:hypothetical protein
LFDPVGRVLAEHDDSGDALNAKLIEFQLPEDGT